MNIYQSKLQRVKKALYSNQPQIDAIIAVRSYIDTHYARPIHLDQLSAVQGISKYHLLRLYKRYYGLTPRQYLIQKRMQQAKEHLKAGMTVTETCFAVGFESLGSFSSSFKRKIGKTPREFQKEQLSRSKKQSDA